MHGARAAFAAMLVAAALGAGANGPARATPEPPARIGRGDVAIFYYPWYGTPLRDGGWQHWQQNGSSPPARIASGWHPARGAYSSSDPNVVRAQMQEIAAAGVQTVVVSWWGPGSVEAARLPLVARLARTFGLRVAVHVEPFDGRTPATLGPQLRELAAAGISDAYIYDSTKTPDADWRLLTSQRLGMRLFANTNLPGKAKAGGFSGLYTYDVLVFDGSSFPRICASARKLGLLCAPSVGPGFDASRATGEQRVKSRADGAVYDRMWRAAIRAGADVVTVTSYNEWHEGTQIEPAAPSPGYASYEGAYGLHGTPAQRAYIVRTALWTGRYRAALSAPRRQ